MGERLLCKQEVIGSIPFTSTSRAAVGGKPRQAVSGEW